MSGWGRGSFRGSFYEGPRTLDGYVGFGFGIDRRNGAWLITHLHSGCLICGYMKTLKSAKALAEAVSTHCPRFVASRKGAFGKPMRRYPPQLREMSALVREARP